MEENYEYKDARIKIERDLDPVNPRDDDNLGTMICSHSRYNLGDERVQWDKAQTLHAIACRLFPPLRYLRELAERGADEDDLGSYEMAQVREQAVHHMGHPFAADMTTENVEEHCDELQNWVLDNLCAMLPLYLYDHSGRTISTTPFSCHWDSGQVGYIYVSLDDARKNWMLPDDAGWDHELDEWWDEEKDEYLPSGATNRKITLRDAAERLLKGEVETYDQYLTGEVF